MARGVQGAQLRASGGEVLNRLSQLEKTTHFSLQAVRVHDEVPEVVCSASMMRVLLFHAIIDNK